MYVVLYDEEIDGGWANAFFDEIVTYYPEAPQADRRDLVKNSVKDGVRCKPEVVSLPWKFVSPVKEDETSKDIVNGGFETGDLYGWTVLEGEAFSDTGVIRTSQRYWGDRAVYGWGESYFDGASREAFTGAMRSTKFTLGGDGWISFMMGAGNGGSYVALCDGETDEELIKVTNDAFEDPKFALTLLRTYMDASAYIGKVVYLKVVDNATSVFGFINVDDFRVSLTEDEVLALETEQLRAIRNETYTSRQDDYKDDLENVRAYYENYDYPVPMASLRITDYAKNQVVDASDNVDLTAFIEDAAAAFGRNPVDVQITKVVFNGEEFTGGFSAFDMSRPGYYHVTYSATYNDETARSVETVEATFTVVVMGDRNSVANGGFEAGNLAGWTVLTDGWKMVDGQAAGVISAETWWGEEIPYNQAGNYHLDGWETGIGEPDGWAVRSSNFTLGGSGFISVRMGGNAAAVHVYKADGTEIGYYKQTRFNDSNFPHLSQGGSWADMGTYVMDLSDYLGEELYIELHDEVIDGGWAHAFFDEVVTYYETAPDYANLADTVMDGHTADESPVEVQIPWQLAENLVEPEDESEPDYVKNQVMTAGGGVDLTAVDLTAFVRAAFGSEAEVQITKVVFNDEEFTDGFGAFDMSRPGYYHVTYIATLGAGAARSVETVEAIFTIVVMADQNSVANGGFESGNLAGWTVLTDGWSIVGGQAAGVISATSYWGENLPYNQAGDYHLDGWNNGIDEPNTWAVQSSTFTLAGSGFISVRMGGKAAAVKVYMADGTLVGYYKQTRFKDEGFPSVAVGSWADMGTYVMNLSDYLGADLYIELHDEVVEGGWAHAFFDEVVTYYETAPDWESKSDTVANGVGAEPATVNIPWQLAANLVEPVKESAPERIVAVQANETTVASDDGFTGEGVPEAKPEEEFEDALEAEVEEESEDTLEAEDALETESEIKSETDPEKEPDHGERPDNMDIEIPKKPEDLGASSEEDKQE